MCFVAAPGGGPALAPRSDIAVCGVGIFGAGGCSCGCASRPEENEENITFYLKRKGLLKDCKTLCFGKISLFENSVGAREGLSLGASGPVLFWCTHGAGPPSPLGHRGRPMLQPCCSPGSIALCWLWVVKCLPAAGTSRLSSVLFLAPNFL